VTKMERDPIDVTAHIPGPKVEEGKTRFHVLATGGMEVTLGTMKEKFHLGIPRTVPAHCEAVVDKSPHIVTIPEETAVTMLERLKKARDFKEQYRYRRDIAKGLQELLKEKQTGLVAYSDAVAATMEQGKAKVGEPFIEIMLPGEEEPKPEEPVDEEPKTEVPPEIPPAADQVDDDAKSGSRKRKGKGGAAPGQGESATPSGGAE